MRSRTRRGARLGSRLNTIESLESRTLLSAQMDGKELLGEHAVATSYTRLHLRPVTQQPAVKRTRAPKPTVVATAATSFSALSEPSPAAPPEFLESLRVVSNADGTSAAIVDYRGTDPGIYTAAIRWDDGPAEPVWVDQPGEFWHAPTIGSAYAYREHLPPGEHTLAVTVGNASTGAYALTSATFTVAEPEPVPADAAGAGPDVFDVSADPASAGVGEASPPQVSAVYVSGSAWTSSFKNYLQTLGIGHATYGYQILATDQLNELPWVNINTVSVRFSEPVSVSTTAPYDLLVIGVNAASYAVTGATYDAATYTATWTLGQSIPKDNILLHVSNAVTDADGNRLDGEWVNGADSFNSGNGQPDGPFNFRLNVLPGDADRDGDVDDVDAAAVRARFFKSTTNPGTTNPYTPFHDMDGNGTIVAGDYGEATKPERVGPGMGDAEPTTTTVATPAAPGGMSAAALAHNHVELFWEDGSSNETGFRIERRTVGGTWGAVGSAGVGVTRFADRTAAANTSYDYRLAAINAAGGSDYASTSVSTPPQPQPGTTPVVAPSLSAEDLHDGKIRLTWQQPSVSTRLEMAANGENFYGGPSYIVQNGLATAEYPGAQADHEYRFRLRVDNGEGGWTYSNEATVVVQREPGGAGIRQVSQSPGMRVSVFWTATKGQQNGFKVFGRKIPDGGVQLLGTAGPDETSLTVSVGSPGLWTFDVLAYNDLIRSPEPPSDFQYAATTVDVRPSAPAPTPDLLSANLNWDGVVYTAELSMTGNYDHSTTDWGTDIEHSWNGRDFFWTNSTFEDHYTSFPLVLGTTNTFRVYNEGSAGIGGASEAAAVTVPGPSAPVGLAATVQGRNVTLTWSHGIRPGLGYVIERKAVEGAYVEVGRTYDTTYPDTVPVPGAAYTYRVTTLARLNDYGLYDMSPSDAYSGPANVSINSGFEAPTAPTNLRVSTYAGGGLDLRWDDNSAFEDGFRVTRTDLTTNTEVSYVLAEDVAQMHEDQGLIAGRTYRYAVVAFSGGGETLPINGTVTATQLPGVWIETIDAGAGEAGPNPGRFIVWRSGTILDRALAVNYNLTGTATPGVDYAGPTGAASIPRNYYGQVVDVTPILDTAAEGNETVIATVASGGYTVGSAATATVNIADEPYAVQVALDANRDGVIRFDGTDSTSSAEPFRFWLNDDSDVFSYSVAGAGGGATDEGGTPDSADDKIGSDVGTESMPERLTEVFRRDLEDFAQVGLWISDLAWGSADRITVGIENASTPQMSLRLWRSVRTSGQPARTFSATDHVTYSGVADAIMNATNNYLHQATTFARIDAGDPVEFTPASFDQHFGVIGASADGRASQLMFEGIGAGLGDLVFRFMNGAAMLAESRVHLDLRPVTDFYEHYTVAYGPAVGSDGTWSSSGTGFDPKVIPVATTPRLESGAGAAAFATTNDYFLFVHGWNNNTWDRISTASTAYKRLYWQGYRGTMGLFSWPTQATPSPEWDTGNFNRSEEVAWNSAQGLLNLLRAKQTNREAQGRLTVLAHSMGGIVASEALALAGNQNVVDTAILTQAAVSIEFYYGAATSGTELYPAFGGQVGGNAPRFSTLDHAATRLVNFNNEGDYALNVGWVPNTNARPGGPLHGHPEQPGFGGALYDGVVGPPATITRTIPGTAPVTLNINTDTYEMFANGFHTPSMPYTVGAIGGIDAAVQPFHAKVNLRDPRYGFGNSRIDHSGQFSHSYIEMGNYWDEAMRQAGLQ